MRFIALSGILFWALGFTLAQPAQCQVREAFELSRKAYDLGRSNPDSSVVIAKQALAIAQKHG